MWYGKDKGAFLWHRPDTDAKEIGAGRLAVAQRAAKLGPVGRGAAPAVPPSAAVMPVTIVSPSPMPVSN